MQLKRKVMLAGARPFWKKQLERLFCKEGWETFAASAKLELLRETAYIDEKMYESLRQDCEELRKILSSITKTTKESLNS